MSRWCWRGRDKAGTYFPATQNYAWLNMRLLRTPHAPVFAFFAGESPRPRLRAIIISSPTTGNPFLFGSPHLPRGFLVVPQSAAKARAATFNSSSDVDTRRVTAPGVLRWYIGRALRSPSSAALRKAVSQARLHSSRVFPFRLIWVSGAILCPPAVRRLTFKMLSETFAIK